MKELEYYDEGYWDNREPQPFMHSNIPVLAYKRCILLKNPYRLGSTQRWENNEGPYDCYPYNIVDYYVCLQPERHTTLDKCVCGFYASKDIKSLEILDRYEPHTVIMPYLLVELYGTVVEHELGYRAEKQRVLKMALDPKRDIYSDILIKDIEAQLKTPVQVGLDEF